MPLYQFHILDHAIVDNNKWFTVVADNEVSRWIYQQDSNSWVSFSKSTVNAFDVCEELLLIMKLKWIA